MKSVCIVVATHNGEKFIGEQLSSIKSSGYNDLSIVVVDDHSTDNTLEVVSQFSKTMEIKIYMSATRQSDRIKRIRDNFFQALSVASADYYFFCDQDDIWATDKLSIYTNYLSSQNIVYSGYELIGEMKGQIRVKNFASCSLLNLLLSNLCPGMCVAFDNNTKEYLLRNRSKVYYHDHGLFLIARKFDLRVKYIAETRLNKYRQHSENAIGFQHRTRSMIMVQWFQRIILNTIIYLGLK